MHSIRFTLLSVLLVAGCKNDDATPSGQEGTDGTGGEQTGSDTADGSTTMAVDPDAPTYYEDVRPVLAAQCAGCHAPNGIGPFDVMDYEVAAQFAPLIAVTVEHRTMPPFNADNSGVCNTFENARWLSDDEIALFRRWSDAGAPEGDPDTPAPEVPAPQVLEGSDVRSYTTPAEYVPIPDDAGPLDDYQCFLLDPGFTEPRYLVGFEVVPGNLAITHHLVGFQVDKTASNPLGGTNESRMQALDDASPDQPGWDCFGAAGDAILPKGTPVTWAPGGDATNFPDGTGIRFEPGDVLVLQMHYNLANGEGSDQTEIRLSWADEVEREAVNVLNDKFLRTAFTGPVTIPPGEKAWVWQWSERLGNWNVAGDPPPFDAWGKVQILGLLPHMHNFGSRMQVNFISAEDGTETCGIYIDRWDFHWQQAFIYEDPFILDPADTIEVTCEWNTSNVTNPVYPGLGTGNEMCLLGIYAAQAP